MNGYHLPYSGPWCGPGAKGIPYNVQDPLYHLSLARRSPTVAVSLGPPILSLSSVRCPIRCPSFFLSPKNTPTSGAFALAKVPVVAAELPVSFSKLSVLAP